jgi:hypothetical protein
MMGVNNCENIDRELLLNMLKETVGNKKIGFNQLEYVVKESCRKIEI